MSNTQVLYMVVLLIITSCSGYTKKDGKVYLRNSNEASIGVNFTEVEKADYHTFEIIDHDLNIDLGKDKDHVFLGTSILIDADPETFEHIKDYYWKDQHHVFLLQFGNNDCKIDHADAKTFEIKEDYLWAMDKDNVYYSLKKVMGTDRESFIVMTEDWGKDDTYYYWHELRLDSLEYVSAKILSPYYIKDKHHVYFKNELVEGANASAFVPDGVGWFGHDDKNMFDWTTNKGPITAKYRRTYIDKK